jgi:excisionase family DNA binding protein
MAPGVSGHHRTSAEVAAIRSAGPAANHPTNDRGDVEQLLTKEEAARILKVAVRYIDRCVLERRIRFVKLGRYIRIPRSAIDEYVARCTVDARPAELAGSRPRQVGAR